MLAVYFLKYFDAHSNPISVIVPFSSLFGRCENWGLALWTWLRTHNQQEAEQGLKSEHLIPWVSDRHLSQINLQLIKWHNALWFFNILMLLGLRWKNNLKRKKNKTSTGLNLCSENWQQINYTWLWFACLIWLIYTVRSVSLWMNSINSFIQNHFRMSIVIVLLNID